MATLGLIGSGKIGGAVARAAVDAGWDVVLSNSRGPETLADLVEEIGPKARAATPAEAAAAGDIVVVTVPLHAYDKVPVEPTAGKPVIDTNNYYPSRDGSIASLDDKTATSSGLLQEHLPDAHVVKAFNNINWSNIGPAMGRPKGADDRTALPISGDDDAAKKAVADLIDAIGFDVVDNGPLSESWRHEPGTPAYGTQGDHLSAIALKDQLAEAVR